MCGVLPFAAACAVRGPATALRLFVLDGGECHTTDVSPWAPGAGGGPWTFVNRCYLIDHERGLLLWETGFADTIAAMPDGLALAGGAIRVRMQRPVLEQLRALGVEPRDVTHLAMSHFHVDHAGNANAFAHATLLVQRLEHAAAFGPSPERFGFDPACYGALRGAPAVLLDGDHDVFGDGSVLLLATPGHTPGHQSLLVRLPRAGALLLSGDVAHFRANHEARRTPAGNFDRAASLRSMARLDALCREHAATLVIHHDPAPSLALPRPPAFLD